MTNAGGLPFQNFAPVLTGGAQHFLQDADFAFRQAAFFALIRRFQLAIGFLNSCFQIGPVHIGHDDGLFGQNNQIGYRGTAVPAKVGFVLVWAYGLNGAADIRRHR